VSLSKIRAALEVGLNGMSPALSTAFENVAFTPTPGTPYQRVNLLPAQPENPSVGAELRREIGVMQVTLCYPFNAGTQAVYARAEAIQARFSRGSTWIKDGVTVIVDITPTIGPAAVDGDRFTVPVSVPYFSNIFS
jgi:hypothetical protein